MYTGMLHTHKLAVVLFLLYYLVRTMLLLTGQTTLLEKIVKRFKVLDMIISTLFLATGIYLGLKSGNVQVGNWFWVKIGAVALAIPVAIIGFKKANKALALLSLLLILYSYGISETKSPDMNKRNYYAALAMKNPVDLTQVAINEADGQPDQLALGAALYANYCLVCHGKDGALGLSGAKDLRLSKLEKDEMHKLIVQGKNGMPSFGKIINDPKIDAIVAYIQAELREKQPVNPH